MLLAVERPQEYLPVQSAGSDIRAASHLDKQGGVREVC